MRYNVNKELSLLEEMRKHTAGEVTEDNEKSLSSGWNFLDLFKLHPQELKNFIIHIQRETVIFYTLRYKLTF